MYTLYCVVEGESTSKAFSVEIEPTQSIGSLKDAIKAKNPDTFNGVDANNLTLWRVDFPITPAKKITLNLPDEESILSRMDLDEEPMAQVTQCRVNKADEATVKFLGDPSMSISDENAFGTGPSARNIHVVVQLPPSGNATHCLMQAFSISSLSIVINAESKCLHLPESSDQILKRKLNEGNSRKNLLTVV
jgi:hypothetical protein